MATQQLVILSRADAPAGSLAPIGRRAEVLAALSQYNTAPEREGEDMLYGPGIRIELSPGNEISQMLLSVVEEEIAWQVVLRIARELNWRLLDPSSGRELTP